MAQPHLAGVPDTKEMTPKGKTRRSGCFLALGALIVLLAACTPAEMFRRTVGISIESLEKEEEGRYAGLVEADFAESYSALLEVLEEKELYIYLDLPGKRYLVAMSFDRLFPRCGDTTEVGFFFREEEPGLTRLEVVSLNRELALSVAEMVFEEIDLREGISMRVQPD